MIILSGSSNTALAQEIADILGVKLADVEISKFPNGEKRIWVKEEVADQTVVIVQSFSDPVDEHIIELSLLADACKHLHAKEIIAVVPWLGYSPQDKSFRTGEPVSVHVIARLIETMGIQKLITADLHSPRSLDFFSIPTVELSSLPLYIEFFKQRDLDNHVVVAVDKGAMPRSEKFANALGLPLCVFEKFRDRYTGEVTLTHKSGEVKGKKAISFDDFVSTGSTRISAANILKQMGVKYYTDCITHGILAGDSPQKIQASLIDEMITTNTYFIPDYKKIPKLRIISIASIIADALKD